MIVGQAENHVENVRTTQTTPRVGGPVLKQPIFDQKAPHNNYELKNQEL